MQPAGGCSPALLVSSGLLSALGFSLAYAAHSSLCLRCPWQRLHVSLSSGRPSSHQSTSHTEPASILLQSDLILTNYIDTALFHTRGPRPEAEVPVLWVRTLSVFLSCCNKNTIHCRRPKRQAFTTILEAGSPRSKCLQIWCLGTPLLLFSTQQKGRNFGVPFMRGLHFQDSDYSWRPHLLMPSPLGVKFHHMNCCGVEGAEAFGLWADFSIPFFTNFFWGKDNCFTEFSFSVKRPHESAISFQGKHLSP